MDLILWGQLREEGRFVSMTIATKVVIAPQRLRFTGFTRGFLGEEPQRYENMKDSREQRHPISVVVSAFVE